MARYEVKRCILDNVNGHHLQRGQIIETEDTAWVARFGNDLRRAEFAPANAEIMNIAGTEEGAIGEVKKAEAEAEPEKQPEKEKEAPKKETPAPKVVTRQQTKVVTSDESDAK